MAIPRVGDVSLLAVRDDVGKTGSFSMNSREATDKLNWDSSARSLTQYRGNVLGCQYLLGTKTLSTYQKGTYNTSYKGSEIAEPVSANSQDVWPDEPRHTQYFQLEGTSGSSSSGDRWSENRHFGILPGGGKVDWQVYLKGEGSGNWSFAKVALVGNRDGFLTGPQTVISEVEESTGTWRTKQGFNLNVSDKREYLTLIVYCVNRAGGSTSINRVQQYAGIRLTVR